MHARAGALSRKRKARPRWHWKRAEVSNDAKCNPIPEACTAHLPRLRRATPTRAARESSTLPAVLVIRGLPPRGDRVPRGREAADVTREQMQACAASLPALERAEFARLHEDASALLREAWELRRRAWAIYRQFAPPVRRRT